MRRPNDSSTSSNRLSAYVAIGVFTLILWSIAIWLWRQAYLWFEIVTPPTFIVTFLALPIPYLLYQAFTRPPAPTTPPPPASDTPAASPPPTSSGPFGWADDWLRWMGNGETHRGTLVVLVIVFWSMLYWNWPTPDVQSLPLALTFPAWGLLTIFGLIAIRQIFFRQTNLPSQEVSASGDTKKSG